MKACVFTNIPMQEQQLFMHPNTFNLLLTYFLVVFDVSITVCDVPL